MIQFSGYLTKLSYNENVLNSRQFLTKFSFFCAWNYLLVLKSKMKVYLSSIEAFVWPFFQKKLFPIVICHTKIFSKDIQMIRFSSKINLIKSGPRISKIMNLKKKVWLFSLIDVWIKTKPWQLSIMTDWELETKE